MYKELSVAFEDFLISSYLILNYFVDYISVIVDVNRTETKQ